MKFCEVSWNSISNKYWKFDVCQSAIILASWDFIHFLSYVCYITELTKSMSLGLYITWIFSLEIYMVEVRWPPRRLGMFCFRRPSSSSVLIKSHIAKGFRSMVCKCLYHICVVLYAPLEQADMKSTFCVSVSSTQWTDMDTLDRP